MLVTKLDSSATIQRVDELLESTYRSDALGLSGHLLDLLVYSVLLDASEPGACRRIFSVLRRRYPWWLDVLDASDSELAPLLEGTSLTAGRLKQMLTAVHSWNTERAIGPAGRPPADLTLSFFSSCDGDDVVDLLQKIEGIDETLARHISTFAMDPTIQTGPTHVDRILDRLGPAHGTSNESGQVLDIGHRLRLNLTHHGHKICRAHQERCGDCVLTSFCAHGRAAVAPSNEKDVVAFDLFAGAGGLGTGFRHAGYRIVLAIESDRNAAQTYRFNNPGVPVIEAKINEETTAQELRSIVPGISKIDVVLAGPPCQGYSWAGSRRPADPQNVLYREVARLAHDLEASAVVLENVPGVRRVNGHGFLHAIQQSMDEAGFDTHPYLLTALDFGVPQRRVRYFFLGARRGVLGAITSPTPTHSLHSEQQSLDNDDDLAETPSVVELLQSIPGMGSGRECEWEVLDDLREMPNLSTMAHSSRVIDKIKRIKAGEGPISYRRLERTEARTIIAGHRALPVHPTRHRTISVREAATIQGFPHDYLFCGPRANQPLQVANAVPPPLAEAVARHLLSHFKSDDPD